MLNSKELYNKVEQLRIKRGLSVSQLNKLAGISHATLNSWKKRGTMPKIEVLESLCVALNYSLSALFYDFDVDKITSEEFELLSFWNLLVEEQKDVIIHLISVMAKNNKKI